MKRTVLSSLLLIAVGCAKPAQFDSLSASALVSDLTSGFTNPVIPENFPDPAILPVDGGYLAFATNTRGHNVATEFSKDLITWERRADALPDLPSWALRGFTWAPDVSALADGSFVMYFSALDRTSGRQCVGAAISSVPTGPFKNVGSEPLICPSARGGAIDPAGFTDKDGIRYIVWKRDGNAIGIHSVIYLQKVAANGVTLIDSPIKLIKNDQSWEAAVVEAPYIIRHNNKYYLFYSANFYGNGSYSMGYATADDVAGPYTKQGQLAVSSNSQGPVIGPGGQSAFRDAAGGLYFAYHSWSPDMSKRPMSIMRINWENDVPQVAPSYGR
jgi:arabinan endo-1,5-alpha-L-arabinosidase